MLKCNFKTFLSILQPLFTCWVCVPGPQGGGRFRVEKIILKTVQLLIHHAAPERWACHGQQYGYIYIYILLQPGTSDAYNVLHFSCIKRLMKNIRIKARKMLDCHWIVTTCIIGRQTRVRSSVLIPAENAPARRFQPSLSNVNRLKHLGLRWQDFWNNTFRVKCFVSLHWHSWVQAETRPVLNSEGQFLLS